MFGTWESEDLWKGTNIDENGGLKWITMLKNGENLMQVVLTKQNGTNEDYKTMHIWDIKVRIQTSLKLPTIK